MNPIPQEIFKRLQGFGILATIVLLVVVIGIFVTAYKNALEVKKLNLEIKKLQREEQNGRS
jgi:hypothetical protein